LANDRRFRILNIVDDVTRECLGAIPDVSISGVRVARELTAIVAHRGKPGMIVSDNGTELTSNAILAWSAETSIAWVADYNNFRPHSSLEYQTPAAFATHLTATGAGRRINRRGSNRRWVKIRWQAKGSIAFQRPPPF
jgi:putative transposase